MEDEGDRNELINEENEKGGGTDKRSETVDLLFVKIEDEGAVTALNNTENEIAKDQECKEASSE